MSFRASEQGCGTQVRFPTDSVRWIWKAVTKTEQLAPVAGRGLTGALPPKKWLCRRGTLMPVWLRLCLPLSRCNVLVDFTCQRRVVFAQALHDCAQSGAYGFLSSAG